MLNFSPRQKASAEMKEFERIQFDIVQCKKEIDELEAFLGKKTDLKERDEVLPFFKKRKHLSTFFASLNPYAYAFNRIAHELSIFGDFTADLVAGDSENRTYCLVEFEDAAPDSVFHKIEHKATREWSSRFEHGFSQIVDWLWKLDSMKNDPGFESLFGDRSIRFTGVLILGRQQSLSVAEKGRLTWRQEKVSIDSNRINCLTYDDVCSMFKGRVNTYSNLSVEDD